MIEYCVDCYENLFIRFSMLITIYMILKMVCGSKNLRGWWIAFHGFIFGFVDDIETHNISWSI